MKKLSILAFGWAFGAGFALYYLACVVMMFYIGENSTVFVFNTLLHGWDTSHLVRMNASFWEEVFGFVVIFVLGWILGTLIAFFYNTYVRVNFKDSLKFENNYRGKK